MRNDVAQIKRAVMGGPTAASMTEDQIHNLVRHINGARVEHPPKGPPGFVFNNNYPHKLIKTTDRRMGKSCRMSHCLGKAGASFNLCLMRFKKEEEKDEQEQAPNMKRPAPGADQNRVNHKESFCGACELVFHPPCSALWHALVFMGADAFVKTPCWYCQNMVRDCWVPEFPADRPPGATSRKMKTKKRARTEEAPPVQEEDPPVQEEATQRRRTKDQNEHTDDALIVYHEMHIVTVVGSMPVS